MLKEFRDFALKGNVLDMAVGIIIGAAFTTIVKSLVDDIMMPPIGVLMGGVDFSNYFIALTSGDAPATLTEASAAGIPALAYGRFINALLQFAIVAFALFLVIKQMNALRRRIARGESPAPAAPPRQEVLLEEIRDALRGKN
ncbi:large conductance mechanosensitive channel protein MscL [Parvibaculum sp.]|uniref:large conductance mechanosensitive channel protein MscL n=1 Tax=Parvibaculum sp. TaxID=2024848 RepID=UPI0034A06A12